MAQVITECPVAPPKVVVQVARVTESRSQAANRWCREGRKAETELFRDNVRRECIEAGLPRHDAREAAWDQCMAAFPPPGGPAAASIDVEPEVNGVPGWLLGIPTSQQQLSGQLSQPQAAAMAMASDSSRSESTRLQGLGDIPSTWPALPANASLAVEIGWVQANRLYVVEERPTGAIVVHLDRAHEPAPSRAAIGWLETSIRSYAKFVDVAAKVTSADTDQAEFVRREQLAIDDIRALLDEMHKD